MSSKLDRETIENVKRLHREGVSRKHISEILGVSLSTVYRTVPTTHNTNCFTRVEGDKACTYKLIKVEPLKDVLNGLGAIGTPIQCQDVSKPVNPFDCLNQSIRALGEQAKNFAPTHKVHLTYDPVDAKDIKYVPPKHKASVLAGDYISLLVESYHPAIPLEFRAAIKARAIDTFRGFDGSLRDMAQKAVHHAVKEAAVSERN
jgi:Transposase and inactivated derivatives